MGILDAPGISEKQIGRKYITLPSGLGWAPLFVPRIYRDMQTGAYSVDPFNPRDLVNQSIWTGAAYHVDVATGVDTNTGLGAFDGDFRSPLLTIQQAIVLGNATGAPYRVYVKAGYYGGSRALTGGSAVEPTQHAAFIGVGGAVRNTASDGTINFSATTDATYTNTYTVSIANLLQIRDMLTRDSSTRFADIPQLADPATVNSAATGGYCISGGLLYLRRADGLRPTDANTLITRTNGAARFVTCTTDLYFENFAFYGGYDGALYCDPVATRNIVTVNCEASYAGGSAYTTASDGVRIRRNQGLVCHVNIRAYGNTKDGLNYHRDSAAAGSMFVLTINPVSKGNGLFGATSCQAETSHDDVVSITVNPDYYDSKGSLYHHIEQAKCAVFGGEMVAGPLNGTSGVARASNDVRMWLHGTKIDAGSGNSIIAEANTGTVYVGGEPRLSGGISATGGGQVLAWAP